jgi:H+/Cl- antiporter ClcA
MGKFMVIIGIIFILLGIFITYAKIAFHEASRHNYRQGELQNIFSVITSIILSILISLLLYLYHRLRN